MLFKLLILAVLMVILRPIVGLIFRLVLRAVFRRGLEYVGERAVAQQPEEIHLTPRAVHEWLDATAIDALVDPLTPQGFEEAGLYTVREMEGIAVRFLVQPEERVVACVYEHPRVGTWIDLVCSRRDGTGITYSTSRPTGLAVRPGQEKVNAPGTGSAALYQRLLQERPAGEWEEWNAGNVAAKFEGAYARETAWRRNRGVTAEEVARQIPQMAGSGSRSSSD